MKTPLSPLDESYLFTAESYLETGVREYAAKDYVRFCENIAASAEFFGIFLLAVNGICPYKKIYDIYGHSVIGIFRDLQNVKEVGLSRDDIENICHSVTPLSFEKPENITSSDEDWFFEEKEDDKSFDHVIHIGFKCQHKKPRKRKPKEFDKGSNGYKYPPKKISRTQEYPHIWVTQEYAKKINTSTVPVLEKLKNNIRNSFKTATDEQQINSTQQKAATSKKTRR